MAETNSASCFRTLLDSCHGPLLIKKLVLNPLNPSGVFLLILKTSLQFLVNMSKSRKLVRLAKSMLMYNHIRKHIAKGDKLDEAYITELIFRTAWLIYFYYDNLRVLRQIEFIQFGTVKQFKMKAALFELIGHSSKIVRSYLKIQKVNAKIALARQN